MTLTSLLLQHLQSVMGLRIAMIMTHALVTSALPEGVCGRRYLATRAIRSSRLDQVFVTTVHARHPVTAWRIASRIRVVRERARCICVCMFR